MESALERWADALADRVNPMVVKEVRQGLRARVFWVALWLVLAACVLFSLAGLSEAQRSDEGGPVLFGAASTALGLVLTFVLPYGAFRSMSKEREDETWSLLLLTGLSPRRILLGKVASAALQGVLFACVAGPFLLFSYQLNGVEVLAVLVSLAWLGLSHLFLTVISVSAATVAQGPALRTLVHLGLIAFLLQHGLGAASAWVLLALDSGSPGLRLGQLLSQGALGGAAFLGGTALVLFESAAARLSTLYQPYARGPRLAVGAQLLALTLLFLSWSQGEADLLIFGAGATSALLLVVGTGLSTDVDGLAGVLARAPGPWVLKPGAWRGFLWVLGLQVAVLAAFCVGAVALQKHGTDFRHLAGVLTPPAYVVGFLSLATLLGRLGGGDERLATRVWVAVLVTLGTGLHLAALPLLPEEVAEVLTVLSPAAATAQVVGSDDAWPLLLVLWPVALGLALAAGRVLERADRTF